MPVHMITGVPGHGKTLNTIARLKVITDRPIFYHGIKELQLNWTLIDDPKTVEDWTKFPPGSIFVIDECQIHYPVRDPKSAVPALCKHLETHRHHGHDFYFITQHPMLVDHHIRRLCGSHDHYQRLFGTARATCFHMDKLFDPNNNFDLKAAEKTVINYPKEVYKLYKSSEVHTVKSRIPKFFYLLPFLFIPIGYGVYHLSSDMPGQGGKVDSANPVNPASSPSGFPDSAATPAPQTKTEWLAALTPVIPSMPYTAPLYRPLTQKPKVMPRLAGCVKMIKTDDCRCFTQQGTPIDLDKTTCEFNLKTVFFNPYRDSTPEHGLHDAKLSAVK